MKTIYALLLAAATVTPALLHAEEVIEEPPASAVKTTYTRNSIGLYLDLWGLLENTESNGWACELYEDGDDVYMSSPLSSYPNGAYIKGKKTEKGLSFPLPQPVWHYTDNDKDEMFYVDMYYMNPNTGEYERDTDPNRSYDLELQPNGCYKFDYWGVHAESNMAGTFYVTDRALCMCEGSTGDWMAYSELTCRLIPFDNQTVVPPADLETKPYQFVYETNGYMVNVGIQGNDIYVQGLNEFQPEIWVKGTVEGDRVSFPSMQYLGIGDGQTIFLAGALHNGENVEYQPYFTMDYDKASGTFSSREAMWLTNTPEHDTSYTIYSTCSIRPLPEKLNETPKAPRINSFSNFDTILEFGRVKFTLIGLNEDDDVLNMENLSYALYIDGDIYILDPADYTRLPEEMMWIPGDFTDNWDIFCYPMGERSVYFYAEVEDNLALQSRYLGSDGEFHYSKMAVWNVNGGAVENVGEELQVVGEANYDMLGRRVSGNAGGLGIKVLRMSDGSIRTVKNVK